MAEVALFEQVGELFRPGHVDLIYRYGHDTCCAEVVFSDGAQCWYFQVSNLLGDALQQLISAFVNMLRYEEPEAEARWYHEPAETRWVLRRQEHLLHVRVLEFPEFALSQAAPATGGHVRLETTVDFWTFAQRVRLAASRMGTADAGSPPHHVSFHKDPEYQALCRFLSEHRRGR
jgi:hypothetical protein